jgi:phage gpG-like protein
VPVRFRIEVDGAEVFDRAFSRLDRLDDFRPIWPNVISEFYTIEQEQFDTEGAAGGQRWAQLSPAYKRWKDVHYPGEPILQREHDLIESLTDPEAPDAVLIPGQEELIIGTKVPYAVVHQRRGRPPISFSESQKRRIQKAIQQGLVRFVREAGFEVREAA